jgi:hypothetical protein
VEVGNVKSGDIDAAFMQIQIEGRKESKLMKLLGQ